ncbi:nucleoid-associated protein [Veillonella montpellierensis]|uniref:nucleoid-associated protein n=1 Tax=Veillonella montpellierensis TaxID=187328 RepID=UPI0023F75206|nr:nucleoid-associated protein [Veillonella montpellierensis]
MQINKAVLEIFDFHASMAAYSDKELDISDTQIQDYISSHVVKALKDPAVRTGSLSMHNCVAQVLSSYNEGRVSFLEMSNQLSQQLFEYMKQATESSIVDIIVCEVEGEKSYFCVLVCQAHAAYTHIRRADENGKTGAELVLYKAMLPTPSQKLQAFMAIDRADLSVRIFEPKGTYDGESCYLLSDKLLQIGTNQSTKDTVKKVKHIIGKVCEAHESDGVEALAMAKTLIAKNAEVSDTLQPEHIIDRVFAHHPMEQAEAKAELEKHDMMRPLPVAREFATKEGAYQKIKTDTGIEITFPVCYMQDKEFIEILTNDDGTLRIELKHINKIINK